MLEANKLRRCLAHCIDQGGGSAQGLNLNAGDSPHTSETRKPLTGEQCVSACGGLFSATTHEPASNEQADAVLYLTQCVQGCHTPSITKASSSIAQTSQSQQQTQHELQEVAAVQDAQTQGLCVLKTHLSNSEAQALLDRNVEHPSVTNANIAEVIFDTSERKTLCLYASMKLITRYLLFMIGFFVLLLVALALWLWLELRRESKHESLLKRGLTAVWVKLWGEPKEKEVERRVIITALMGIVIILLSQIALRILRTLL